MDYLTVSSPTAVAPPSGPIISDVELAHKAKNLLRWKIRYNSIRVEANKGHVILTGKVDWPSDIAAAEQTIRKLRGVLSVTNRIVD